MSKKHTDYDVALGIKIVNAVNDVRNGKNVHDIDPVLYALGAIAASDIFDVAKEVARVPSLVYEFAEMLAVQAVADTIQQPCPGVGLTQEQQIENAKRNLGIITILREADRKLRALAWDVPPGQAQ